MLYGFGTRRIFTPFMKPFIERAGGKWHEYKDVGRYDKTHWYDFTLKEWLNEEEPGEPVVFGNLRGTADIIRAAEQNNINYYYFDHAYLHKAHTHKPNPIFNKRFYRITKNGEQLTKLLDWTKTTELKTRVQNFEDIHYTEIGLSKYRNKGDKILILPPTEFICSYYQLGGEDYWTAETIKEIRKYTDRDIVVRKKPEIGKQAPIPFEQQLEDAYCVVTHQTSAVVDVLRYGIPVFCSEYSCALPIAKTDLSEIENPYYPTRGEVRDWIYSLLTGQFTEDEIISGKAKEIIDITQ